MERHVDHFAPDCADEAWLREVAARNWVAVTHDARIRYKPNELSAVMSHGVSLLVVVGHAQYADLAASFALTAPRIFRFLDDHDPPFIGKVYRPSPSEAAREPRTPGRVELWHPRR